MLFCIQEEN